eukprot:NODE_1978_length_857_cov_100.162129_g1386_i0.p1 GENE.NODE_1978_length_857_cov_100.162129_g1386_i0~~NODE_1978_length_857_cov_100.162129_g1386_i0.p1  ORF type:complete len:216 (-),score=34.37 NODE_1978_length_857_cov_100.162129_g1386_i0:157-804(-)
MGCSIFTKDYTLPVQLTTVVSQSDAFEVPPCLPGISVAATNTDRGPVLLIQEDPAIGSVQVKTVTGREMYRVEPADRTAGALVHLVDHRAGITLVIAAHRTGMFNDDAYEVCKLPKAKRARPRTIIELVPVHDNAMGFRKPGAGAIYCAMLYPKHALSDGTSKAHLDVQHGQDAHFYISLVVAICQIWRRRVAHGLRPRPWPTDLGLSPPPALQF